MMPARSQAPIAQMSSPRSRAYLSHISGMSPVLTCASSPSPCRARQPEQLSASISFFPTHLRAGALQKVTAKGAMHNFMREVGQASLAAPLLW